MSKIRGTINLPNTPLGQVFTDDGTFSSSILASTAQLTVKYNNSNYLTISVASNGVATFNATGSAPSSVFSDGVIVATLTSTGAITADLIPSAGSQSIIGSERLRFGKLADSFLVIESLDVNQWHAHPNALMLDTTGLAQFGDAQGFGNATRIDVHDINLEINLNALGVVSIGDVDMAANTTRIEVDAQNDIINIHNHAGPIQIGDTDSNVNSIVFTVRDDVQRFKFSNGDDTTPFALEFPSSGGGGMIAGSSTELIAFWGATPRVQPTTAHAAATFVQNISNTVHETSTFDGYTLKQVVKALRDVGILA